MLTAADQPRALWAWRNVAFRLLRKWLQRKPETDVGGAVSSFFGDSALSKGILPLLGMGRDVPDGRMRLADDRLEVDWSKGGASRPYFERIRDRMRDALQRTRRHVPGQPALVVRARSLPFTRSAAARWAATRTRVSSMRGATSSAVPGLYIADGSVMPGPVGANPSLTIAALADRFSDGILDARQQ